MCHHSRCPEPERPVRVSHRHRGEVFSSTAVLWYQFFFFLLKLCNRKWHTGWIHMDDLSQVGVAPTIRVTLRESISVASAALLFRPCASGVLLTCFHYCPLSHCSFAYPSVFHPDNVFCALVTFIGCLSFLRAIRALQLLKLNTHSAFNQC